jgi:hypothetical protein
MKRNKKTSKLQKRYSILFLALPFLAMAQEALPGGTTNDTTDVAPIDDYLPLALLLCIYFAYRFLKPTLIPKQLNN